MTPLRTLALAALAASSLIGSRAGAAEMKKTYVALGDSVAFGYTDDQHATPSLGDQGYVKPFADALVARDGVRPNVINLGVPGETTSSFFAGGQPGTSLNLNYPDAFTSQNDKLITTLVGEKAAGRTVSDVTISLGPNDLFGTALSQGFAALNPAQQQALITRTLAIIGHHYSSLLTEVQALAPGANLVLVGAYNPFPAVPGSPFAGLAGPAIQGLNAVIKGEAAAFGGHYVDTYTPFLGHEADYTHITDPPAGSNNVHPNDLGYGVIAKQVEAAAIPEPSTLLVTGTGLLGLLGCGRRRQAAPAR